MLKRNSPVRVTLPKKRSLLRKRMCSIGECLIPSWKWSQWLQGIAGWELCTCWLLLWILRYKTPSRSWGKMLHFKSAFAKPVLCLHYKHTYTPEEWGAHVSSWGSFDGQFWSWNLGWLNFRAGPGWGKDKCLLTYPRINFLCLIC